MSAPSRALAAVLGAALALAAPCRSPAANSGGDGLTICGKAYDPGNRYAWEEVRQRYADRIDASAYPSVIASLRGELLASDARTDADTIRFDLAASRFERAFPSQCSDFEIFKDEGGRDLTPTRYWLFHDEPSEAILLNRDCSDPVRVARTQNLRHLAGSFVELCELALKPLRDEAATAIETLEARFDRYLFEGFPMFPWEALANGALLSRKHLAEGPPRNQLVLFHPLAGILVRTASFAEAEPDIALGVDLVGWVHYPARYDYRSWWGASAMASVANGRGTGVGIALQWDNFRLAAAYHDDDRDGRLFDGRPSVFLGLDLYHFLGAKHRSYAEYRTKLRDLEVGSR